LPIGRDVVEGIDLSSEVIDDDEIEFLILGLAVKVAFRAKSGASYKRNVVASLRQQFAGNHRIFLRTAENEPGYYMNDTHNFEKIEDRRQETEDSIKGSGIFSPIVSFYRFGIGLKQLTDLIGLNQQISCVPITEVVGQNKVISALFE